MAYIHTYRHAHTAQTYRLTDLQTYRLRDLETYRLMESCLKIPRKGGCKSKCTCIVWLKLCWAAVAVTVPVVHKHMQTC